MHHTELGAAGGVGVRYPFIDRGEGLTHGDILNWNTLAMLMTAGPRGGQPCFTAMHRDRRNAASAALPSVETSGAPAPCIRIPPTLPWRPKCRYRVRWPHHG